MCNIVWYLYVLGKKRVPFKIITIFVIHHIPTTVSNSNDMQMIVICLFIDMF